MNFPDTSVISGVQTYPRFALFQLTSCYREGLVGAYEVLSLPLFRPVGCTGSFGVSHGEQKSDLESPAGSSALTPDG